MESYLVLDIGGTFVKYAIMTRDGQYAAQGKVPSSCESEEAAIASLALVREQVDTSGCRGMAISMPGRIDTTAGIARTGGAYAWIHDYPAAERYGKVFDLPATIANDGKCAALAESWLGALSDVDSGAVLVLGTGVGGGIVLDGRVWMGATGGAGELSGLMANFDLLRGGFTAEAYGAMWANRISASAITSAFAMRKGLEQADGIMLFDAYEAGDADAIDVLDEFSSQAAAGILSLQATLDLPRYAIGGGISARPATTELIRAKVDALFDTGVNLIPFGRPEIVTCAFGNEANLIGALAFHLKWKGLEDD
jgi:predicted NBD/HSP70 family sugar kinase